MTSYRPTALCRISGLLPQSLLYAQSLPQNWRTFAASTRPQPADAYSVCESGRSRGTGVSRPTADAGTDGRKASDAAPWMARQVRLIMDWNRRTVVTDDMPGKAGSGALRTGAMPKARELVLRKKEMPSAGRPEQRLRSRPYPVTRQDFRHFQSRATPDSSCMSIRREQVRPGSDAQRTPEARGPAQSGGAPLPGPGRERLSGNL